MSSAYQIIFSSNPNTVVGSLDLAIQHMAAMLRPETSGAIPESDFPELAAIGCAGTYPGRVLYTAHTDPEGGEITLIEHDLEARPGYDTERWLYQVGETSDPAGLVQQYLFDLGKYDEPHTLIEEHAQNLADDLFVMIEDELVHRAGDPAELLEGFRNLQSLFWPLGLFPDQGDPVAILRGTPAAGAAIFRSIAEKAFPTDA